MKIHIEKEVGGGREINGEDTGDKGVCVSYHPFYEYVDKSVA